MAIDEKSVTPFGLTASYRIKIAILAAGMLATCVFAVGTGAVSLSPETVVKIISHQLFQFPDVAEWPPSQEAIVWKARMPRVIMACAVGAVLGVCGAALQAIVRNPMADPYVLGISSGASVGAAFAVLVPAAIIGAHVALPLYAFGGALFASALVLYLGSGNAQDTLRLILSGVVVGFALNSITNFLVFASDNPDAARSVLFWLLGSMAAISWWSSMAALSTAILCCLFLWLIARVLDALAEGDESALSLGINPTAARIVILAVISLAIAVVVAGAGAIGFIGLVIPHLARGIVGYSHRKLIPACAFLGGAFLVLSDIVSRTLFAPAEMPIGVVTGIAGAPLLLWLIRSSWRQRV